MAILQAIFRKHPAAEQRTGRVRHANVPPCAMAGAGFHGGLSTGPKAREGLERIRQAAIKHGRYSQHAKAEQRQYRELLCSFRAFLNGL